MITRSGSTGNGTNQSGHWSRRGTPTVTSCATPTANRSPPSIPSSFTVTGLANGTDYDFQVRVRNDAGWSKPSAWSHLVTPAAPPGPPRGVTVPHNWTYIPKDAEGNPLKPGEKFRLLFVTGGGHRATSTDINWYNKQVQDELPRSFSSIAEQYRAIISTAAVNARDNIGNVTDVPVYWVNGGLIVGTWIPDDLFEDEWVDRVSRNSTGAERPAPQVWTGSNRSGNAWSYPGLRFYAGAPHVWVGSPQALDHRGDPIGTGAMSYPTWGSEGKPPAAEDNQLPLYGISPVFTVQAPIWEATLTVDVQLAQHSGCDSGDP